MMVAASGFATSMNSLPRVGKVASVASRIGF